VLCTGLFFAMPFFYSLNLNDSELSPRFVCLSAIVLLISLWMMLQIRNLMKERIGFRLSGVCRWILIFMGVVAISFFNASNKTDAFFELLKAALMISVFFIVHILLMRNFSARFALYKSINAGVFIFSAIGVLQYAELISTEKLIRINYSISSCLANKNFYSETVLIAVPFLVAGMINLNRVWKIISAITLLFAISTLLILKTISAWVAAGTAIIFFMAALIIFRQGLIGIIILNRKKIVSYLIAVVLILIVAAAFTFKYARFNSGIIKRITLAKDYISNLSKMEMTGQMNDNSVYERLILWRNSVKLIQDHPVLGAGLGEWKIQFPAYGMGAARYMNAGFIRFTRPHNDYLHIASESGLVGLICFIMIFISGFVQMRKCINSDANRKVKMELLLLGSAVLIYCVISLFSMPFSRYYPFLMTVMALAMIQSYATERFDLNLKHRITVKFVIPMLLLFIAAGGIGLFYGWNRLQSDIHLSKALYAQRSGNWSLMSRELDRVKLQYFNSDYNGTPVEWYKGLAKFHLGDLAEAGRYFQKAEQQNPNHILLLNDLGSYYDQAGFQAQAIEYYYKALRIAPYFPDALLNLAIVYYNNQQTDSAFNVISKYIYDDRNQYFNILNAILVSKAAQYFSEVSETVFNKRKTELLSDKNQLLQAYFKAHKNESAFRSQMLILLHNQ